MAANKEFKLKGDYTRHKNRKIACKSNIVNENTTFTSVSDFTAIDAGAVTITVSNGSTVNVTRTITLESQKVYTVLLSGIAGETGDKAPQIKYIVNGTVDGTAGRVSGSSVLTSN